MKNYKYIWSYEFDDEITAKLAEMSILTQFAMFIKLFGVVDKDGVKFERTLNVINVYSDHEEFKHTVENIFIPEFMDIMTEMDK